MIKNTNSKMAAVSPSLSVITLNVNRLNSPIKRQRLAEWISKKSPIVVRDPTMCCTQVS